MRTVIFINSYTKDVEICTSEFLQISKFFDYGNLSMNCAVGFRWSSKMKAKIIGGFGENLTPLNNESNMKLGSVLLVF
jgi:hypothetical protein